MNKIEKLKLINFLMPYLDSTKEENKAFSIYILQTIKSDASDEYFDNILETLGAALREDTTRKLDQMIESFVVVYAFLIDKLKNAKKSFLGEFELVDESILTIIKLDKCLMSDSLLLYNKLMCDKIVSAIDRRVNKIRRINFSGSINLDDEDLAQFVESFIKLFYARILVIDTLINNEHFTDFNLVISKGELKVIDELIEVITALIAERNIEIKGILEGFNVSDGFNNKIFYLNGGKHEQ